MNSFGARRVAWHKQNMNIAFPSPAHACLAAFVRHRRALLGPLLLLAAQLQRWLPRAMPAWMHMLPVFCALLDTLEMLAEGRFATAAAATPAPIAPTPDPRPESAHAPRHRTAADPACARAPSAAPCRQPCRPAAPPLRAVVAHRQRARRPPTPHMRGARAARIFKTRMSGRTFARPYCYVFGI